MSQLFVFSDYHSIIQSVCQSVWLAEVVVRLRCEILNRFHFSEMIDRDELFHRSKRVICTADVLRWSGESGVRSEDSTAWSVTLDRVLLVILLVRFHAMHLHERFLFDLIYIG